MDKLKLEVLLAAIDKVTRPLKAIQSGSSDTAKALKAAKEQLKELNRAQENISAFQKVSKDASVTANMLKAAQAEVKRIKLEIEKVPVPTRDMARAMKDAKEQAAKLKEEHNALIVKQQHLRDVLKGSGIETGKLNDKQRELKAQMATATGEIGKQSAALDVLKRRQQTLHAARANYDKTIGMRNKMAMAGATTTAAGVAMGMPIVKAVKDYASFEDAMLGVARQVDGARDANGNLTKTYYEMGESIKSMSERIPLATTEIAAIIEAGARMGIQGKANLLAYAETTAVMATAFDLPVDQVGEDVGKIAALYKVPIKSINELGDVINYLDDNALSKGGEIIDVMKRIAGTADSVGMKYREAAALASTFLSLGANSEVAASASNAMMTNLSVATMQSKRFQAGLDMLKMNAKGVQIGMSKDATGTILKVMDAIKSLPQEKQLEATTRLFGKEFGDDAAKLASNLGEYRRQLELVNAAKAKGSMQREGDARNQAMSAQFEMMKNTVFNLSSSLGESLKPALVDIMQSIAGVLSGVRDWVKEHPQLTANLVKGAAIIAVIVTGLGALTLAAAAVLGPLAALKLGMAMFPAAGAVLSWLNPLAKLTAEFTAGYALGSLINVGISAALSHFMGEGTTLGTAIYDLVQFIKLKLGELWQWFSGLPMRFIEAGKNLMIGLGDGIMSGLGYVKDKITGAGEAVISRFKAKLGIHSPSRVFAELGGFTMQGLQQGIMGGTDGPLNAVRDTAKKLAAIGMSVAIGGTAMAMPALPDAVRNISETYQPSALREVKNITRTITDQHQAIPLPALPDAVRNISETYQPVALREVRRMNSVMADGDGNGNQNGERQHRRWPPIKNRPISPSAMMSQASAAPFQPIFNIYPSPGMNEQQLAQLVAREIEKLNRQQAAKSRSRLTDRE